MSDCSLSSADQLTPAKREQRPSTSRNLGTLEKTRFMVVLFCAPAPSEHPFMDCEDKLSCGRTTFYPGEAVKTVRSFRRRKIWI
jgi:hypothetical protein